MPSADERMAKLLGGTNAPLWIFTVAASGERSGCLIGFATQCSIDPVRFLACISRVNHTFGPAMEATHVAVHAPPAPDDDPEGLASLFGEETGDEIDKFARCRWHDGPEGQPILDGCDGWFVGEVIERHDLGDHVGLVLEPVAGEGSVRGALTLEQAQDLDAGHPA